jgi:hypothetical protein
MIYYGCQYTNFSIVKIYPDNVEELEAERKKLFQEARLTYKSVIDKSIYNEGYMIDKPDSVLNFCFNTIIDDLNDSKGPVEYLGPCHWAYTYFFEDVKISKQYCGCVGFVNEYRVILIK